nr:hypothetical protein [Rosistilla oblonga]
MRLCLSIGIEHDHVVVGAFLVGRTDPATSRLGQRSILEMNRLLVSTGFGDEDHHHFVVVDHLDADLGSDRNIEGRGALACDIALQLIRVGDSNSFVQRPE